MGYKTTDGLMRHLRENGISISGSTEKRQLINTGYFHGYKGYRFLKLSKNRLPFTSYKEIYATIEYDTHLKTLFYEKIMFIETAVKNIALEGILENANSESVRVICDKVVSSYNNAPFNSSNEDRKKYQQNKLNLLNLIHSSISKAYRKNNPKIAHFYNQAGYSEVPVWALFEILTLGDFGYLLSCLTYEVRDDISKRLGLNLSCDTNRSLLYKYIYTLKGLRNSIAHNSVIFDTRFCDIEPSKAMRQCLQNEFNLSYVNFQTIGDYIILVCYYLKLLKVSKREIKHFILSFEKITDEYKSRINTDVAAKVIHPDFYYRMGVLKNSL